MFSVLKFGMYNTQNISILCTIKLKNLALKKVILKKINIIGLNPIVSSKIQLPLMAHIRINFYKGSRDLLTTSC